MSEHSTRLGGCETWPLISHSYRVAVEFSGPIDKPRQWNLEVVDANGKQIKGLITAYPQLLVPLSEASAGP